MKEDSRERALLLPASLKSKKKIPWYFGRVLLISWMIVELVNG